MPQWVRGPGCSVAPAPAPDVLPVRADLLMQESPSGKATTGFLFGSGGWI